MRVVIGIHHFLPRYTAGGEVHALDAARWLGQQGHDVSVVCVEDILHGPDEGVAWTEDTYEGVPVRRLSFDLRQAPDRFRWEYDDPWIENHLHQYLGQHKPDVFHLVSGYLLGAGALRAARKLRIPTVVTLTDFWFLCPRINFVRSNGKLSDFAQFDPLVCARCKFEEKRRFRIPAQWAPGLVDRVWKYLGDGWPARWGPLDRVAEQFRLRDACLIESLGLVDAVICPTRFLVEKFARRGLPPGKMTVNPHGLACSQWQPIVDEPDRSIFRIGYIGQVAPHKGVHLLIQAFRRLRTRAQTELVIYGDDSVDPPYARQVRALAQDDKRIRILGRFKNDQVARILAGIHVAVVPSTWNEIGPLVMYEALQTKTPVIASNLPNMSYEIRHEKNGLLFTPGDETSLATQLQRLLDEPTLLDRLKAGIGPIASLDQEMRGIEAVYQSVTGARSPAPVLSV